MHQERLIHSPVTLRQHWRVISLVSWCPLTTNLYSSPEPVAPFSSWYACQLISWFLWMLLLYLPSSNKRPQNVQVPRIYHTPCLLPDSKHFLQSWQLCMWLIWHFSVSSFCVLWRPSHLCFLCFHSVPYLYFWISVAWSRCLVLAGVLEAQP